MDKSGMEVGALRVSGAEIAYVMPSHQYPTGLVMPIGRRQELLKWASEDDKRYIIEDDHDSEFRYKGKPVPCLQSIDRHGKVIYMGTFSKAIAPAIRHFYRNTMKNCSFFLRRFLVSIKRYYSSLWRKDILSVT